jgi:hypothetical protein
MGIAVDVEAQACEDLGQTRYGVGMSNVPVLGLDLDLLLAHVVANVAEPVGRIFRVGEIRVGIIREEIGPVGEV